MSRYRPLWPVLLVVLLALWLRSIACFTVTKQSSTTSPGRQGASLTAGKNNSTFSLFAEGQFPTDWDNDILRQISRLHTQPFNGIKEYLLAKNMASYVGLKPIDALHMPVPLSLVFLGFDGDGNGGVTIPHTVLQSWFERLDHILPHTRVPMSSISCSEDGHCPGLDGSSRPDVLPSYVHLNFSCHAVKLSAAVVPVFDRALSIFSRPVDPAAAADAEQQVDLGAMEEMVDDLLDSLGLQSSYTVLVLNPSFEAQRPRYGYVDGFSYAEVQLLGNDPQLHSFLAQVPGHSASSTRSSRAGTLPGQQQQQNRYNNLGWWSRPSNKFAVHDLQWLSESWAKRYHSVLDQAEVLRKKLKEQLGAGVKSTAHLQAALVLQYGSASERERLAQMLKSQLQKDAGFAGEEVEDTTQQQALRVMEPVEGCMLDVWVGAGRWVMLDLTAKGNDWGPWVGGQGVKTDATLPRVEDFFLQDSMQQGKEERSKKLAEKDRELTTELELLKVERLAAVQHEHAMAKSWRAHSRAHSAPGTPPPPVDAADSGVSDAVMLQAELDVYEEFALRKCNNVVNPPPVCQKIKWEVLRLMEDLEEMARNPASTHAIHHQRAHGWDIFGALVEDEEESEDDTSAAGRAMALFMAKLGTAISRGIRHVLAPPTATWRTQASHRRPGRKPFHKKVDFLLYIIGDSPSPAGLRSNGPRNKQAINTFDVEGFKKEVAQLALNGQEFKFVERYMTLQDDPALATAFSLSLRSAALEEHHVPSETAPERLFVDSLELGFQLNHHFMAGNTAPHTAAAMKHTKGGGEARVQKGDQARERLEVPVFVFVVERDRPVFIDQHYLSKALPDMVLVMSNRAHRGRHPMGLVCDRNVVSRDPASPLQAALAATVQHLAGILPPHLGYSPGHHAVLHDWLWSVGRNPMALMAKGTHFGQINLDAVHRSFVLDALDSSVESTNEAISMLLAYPTEALAFPAVSKNTGRLRSLLKGFDSLVGAWRQLVSDCEHLDFSLATSELARVEQLTKAFQDQVQDFLDAISSGCSAASHVRAAWQRSQGGLLLSLLIYAGMVAATVAALAVIGTAMYFKRPKKPKVN